MIRRATLMVLLLSSAMTLYLCGCGETGRSLDKMLDEGNFDEVILEAEKIIKENPEDYGTIIVLGDAYYMKAKDYNMKAGQAYTPEGAAIAKKAIDYYFMAKKINPSMRLDRKIGIAGALMSPP